MSHGIVKVGDYFCEWSGVVDAPVSPLFPYIRALGKWGEDRVDRANRHGHSYADAPPDLEYWRGNRAGEGPIPGATTEWPMTAAGLIAAFAWDSPMTEWPDPVPEEWIDREWMARQAADRERDAQAEQERRP